MNTRWQLFKSEPALADNLARECNIPPPTAQVLINRGLRTLSAISDFLRPSLKILKDPRDIPDIQLAAERVLQARQKQEKVLVFGDYDVDGVTGTAILIHTLKFLGLAASYYIPHRYGEGYSLSSAAVEKIAALGVKLIITVDCGIGSYEEIAQANSSGLDVIVTDHHNLPAKLPAALALVNPKRIAGEHPSKYLSGAGVAFKFAWALLRAAGEKDSVFLTGLLDLAALGTISDVVPLTGENRAIAVMGLKYINERKRLGIKCLAEAAALYKTIGVNQIYFGLAPRINAAGRLEHASKSVELMITDDPEQAQALAEELNGINVRRRGIGENIKEEVFGRLTDDYIAQHKLVVLAGANWHPGVIGIVAAQVVDRFFRPTVLIGINEGMGRGSARSIDGVNMFELLNTCADLFLDFGGHEGAAGFEINVEKIDELKQRLKKEVDKIISFEQMRPQVVIDAELDPAQITLTLIKELAVLDPHGEQNPPPVFMSRHLKLTDVKTVGKNKKHLKAKFAAGEITLDTIGFSMGEMIEKKLETPQLIVGYNYDIAYRLESNEWDGFETAQLSLVDIRRSET